MSNSQLASIRRPFILAVALVLLALLAACALHKPGTGGSAGAGDTITFGFVGALTGDAAAYGGPSQKGVQLAVEEINVAGGINGKKLEIIYEDGKCNGRDAAAAFQKLVSVEKVEVVIGGSCSGETLSMAPLAESSKTLLFSPVAGSPKVTDAGDFIFRNAPSDAVSGKALAEGAYNKLKLRKVAMISENTDYAQGIRGVFSQNFQDLGGKIVSDENFNPQSTDFRSILVKTRGAKPDSILINPQGPQAGSLIAIQARELGLNMQILTNKVLGSTGGIKNAGDAAEGMIWTMPILDENTNPTTKKFLDAYRKRFNEEPNYPLCAATSYDAAHILAKAVTEVGLDTEKIRDWLYQLKDYDGASGKATIDEHGDTIFEASLFVAEKGQMKLYNK